MDGIGKAQQGHFMLRPRGALPGQKMYLISRGKEEVGGGGVVAAPFFHVIVAFRQCLADRPPEQPSPYKFFVKNVKFDKKETEVKFWSYLC